MTKPLDLLVPRPLKGVEREAALAFSVNAKSASQATPEQDVLAEAVPEHAMRITHAAAKRAVKRKAKPMTEQQIKATFSK